ncbi:hypothetical protein [Yinghuangia soli]|uniref:Uncharacterized protein n=1 Tax=Yinghuangia soli TaxID=2908204 RepID=A0AA41Q5B8_9ACTN|nr:hypothetical protein [Yinghuangia soli]MCF2530679.1 hypothetical protein [Yinghuangia soli]
MMNRTAESADPASVALELAELRRSVDVGFATTRGDLALLLQRADQTDKELAEHDARIHVLERARWPLPSIAALTGVSSLCVAVWQASGR